MSNLNLYGDIEDDGQVKSVNIDTKRPQQYEKYPQTQEPKPIVNRQPEPIQPQTPDMTKKILLYIIMCFLVAIFFVVLANGLWFNSSFSKLKDKDFSQDIPVNIYENNTNEFNNNITNNYQNDITNEHTINNQFNLTTKIEIPQAVINSMTEDIIDGIINNITFFNITNNNGFINCTSCTNNTNCTGCNWYE